MWQKQFHTYVYMFQEFAANERVQPFLKFDQTTIFQDYCLCIPSKDVFAEVKDWLCPKNTLPTIVILAL